jgi:hypothetical protein
VVEGVGVMRDEQLNLEEIEVSHTLGGVGRCYDDVIHTHIHQSRGHRHTMSGWVDIEKTNI